MIINVDAEITGYQIGKILRGRPTDAAQVLVKLAAGVSEDPVFAAQVGAVIARYPAGSKITADLLRIFANEIDMALEREAASPSRGLAGVYQPTPRAPTSPPPPKPKG